MLTDDQRAMYASFAQLFTHCWACGRTPSSHNATGLEIAHIVGGPGRTADRRDICRLCRQRHNLNHRFRIRNEITGKYLPFISLENMLWLKLRLDPEFYDLKFIRSLRIKHNEPIKAKVIPLWFRESYAYFRGVDHFGRPAID